MIYHHLPAQSQAREVVLKEMICRAMKEEIFSRMRQRNLPTKPTDEKITETFGPIIVEVLRFFQDQRNVREALLQKYFRFKHYSSAKFQVPTYPREGILVRIQDLVGVTFSERAIAEYNKTGNISVEGIVSLQPVIKRISVAAAKPPAALKDELLRRLQALEKAPENVLQVIQILNRYEV
jgi:hypothetical protein